MSNLSSGQKAAKNYIASIGIAVDYHIPAGIANIVYGYRNEYDACLNYTKTYLRTEGVRMEDDQVDSLLKFTRAAL